jgi:hypothetical protein
MVDVQAGPDVPGWDSPGTIRFVEYGAWFGARASVSSVEAADGPQLWAEAARRIGRLAGRVLSFAADRWLRFRTADGVGPRSGGHHRVDPAGGSLQ